MGSHVGVLAVLITGCKLVNHTLGEELTLITSVAVEVHVAVRSVDGGQGSAEDKRVSQEQECARMSNRALTNKKKDDHYR